MSLIRQVSKMLIKPSLSKQQGVGMLEVMIALLLITTTLLGATALQLTGMQTNRSAYYRTQASMLAYDIADRIRINATYALASESNYEINTASSAAPSTPGCITANAGCSNANIATQDIREWSENFFDVAGIGADGADYKTVLPNGAGSVVAAGASYTVQVQWDELDWNVTAGTNKADRTKSFTLDFTLAN